MNKIEFNLLKIIKSISIYEKKYSRNPGSVNLVIVSKSQSINKIQTALLAGQKHFGENYLKEALIKIHEINDSNIIWHYIGKIQKNKAKLIAQNFSWVESVDNYDIAVLLNKYRQNYEIPLNICIQVNISNETSKCGIPINQIKELAIELIKLPKIKLRGIMAIPVYCKNFNEQFKVFNNIANEFLKLKTEQNILVDTLSIGMSQDYKAAIAAGATTIRIGTAIFGKREV